MTAIKKRYTQRDPEFEQYSRFFDIYITESKILNPSKIHPGDVYSPMLTDRRSVQTELFRLQGDENGLITNRTYGTSVPAYIPAVQEKLRQLKAKFAEYCSERDKQGFKIPEVMPPDMLKERLQLEAKLDCFLREAEQLENMLAKHEEVQEEIHNSECLSHGPLGNGVLKNGDLESIDGQAVSRINGILVITESGSPYKGMSVRDYRSKISEPWCKQRAKELHDLVIKRNSELKKTGFSDIQIPARNKRISRVSLPAWPKGIENHLAKENVTK